jgi:2-iminobutanoate/2-iminopropanoate deaminase
MMSANQLRTKIGQPCSTAADAATTLQRFRSYCAALVCLLCLASTLANADTEFLASAETKALGLPFSDAVRINDLLVLSGQLGVEPSTFKLVEGGIEAETRQIFSNMQRILAASDAGLEDIVKCTVMIADIAEWPLFNTLYVSYFPGNKPARSAFGANGLALGARVELECWADLAGVAGAQ